MPKHFQRILKNNVDAAKVAKRKNYFTFRRYSPIIIKIF